MEKLKIVIQLDCGVVDVLGATEQVEVILIDHDTLDIPCVTYQEPKLMTDLEIKQIINDTLL